MQKLIDTARTALAEGKDEYAYGVLAQVIQTEPDNQQALFLLSVMAHKYANYRKEQQLLLTLCQLNPGHDLYRVFLARAHVLCGETDQAYPILNALDIKQLTDPVLLDAVASSFNRMNLYRQACIAYQRLAGIDDTQASTFFNLASSFKFCGQFSHSEQAYFHALKLNSGHVKAQAGLSHLTPTGDAARIESLLRLQQQISDVDSRLHLAHAISKELEQQQQYQAAFQTLTQAKLPLKAQLNYQFEQDDAKFELVQQNLMKPITTVIDDTQEIFIVGMPRTGTTLLERIISAPDNVVSAGELYQFSLAVKEVHQQINPEFSPLSSLSLMTEEQAKHAGQLYKKRTSYFRAEPQQIILDKLPLNILYAAHILQALPSAKIVCLVRNPLDTIVANYRQLFAFEDRAACYSLSLMDTARFYQRFIQLVNQLAARYPQRFIVVNYEELVQQPEVISQNMFSFLGLTWQSQYVQIEKNQAPVATASSIQVRQGISTANLNNWQRYDCELTEVKNWLAEQGLI
ncbi:tetratricopeptide repeat-containing sulfotransferase family protein [Neptunicella marina]|uniref:Sulfotransferase n=1 Tax=Neptunicella marina TaxID=2125989 RepID=A0A8J6IWQ3_9ALTE|nr:sulfotransferase [Neptunicella marina]MBC3767449.1 sulfotransferase [Neptunicella marina]